MREIATALCPRHIQRHKGPVIEAMAMDIRIAPFTWRHPTRRKHRESTRLGNPHKCGCRVTVFDTRAVSGPAEEDVAVLVGVLRIVVREVDEPALLVPDVFAMDRHVTARRDRHARRDAYVVRDEYGLRAPVESDDEALMGTVGPGLVAQQPLRHPIGRDLKTTRATRKGVLDLRVPLQVRLGAGSGDSHGDRYEEDVWSSRTAHGRIVGHGMW